MAKAESTDELAARVTELEQRVKKMEARRDELGVRSLLRKMLPPEVRGHLRAARKEQLLAARSFLDHWIERSERESTEAPRRRESIRVE